MTYFQTTPGFNELLGFEHPKMAAETTKNNNNKYLDEAHYPTMAKNRFRK